MPRSDEDPPNMPLAQARAVRFQRVLARSQAVEAIASVLGCGGSCFRARGFIAEDQRGSVYRPGMQIGEFSSESPGGSASGGRLRQGGWSRNEDQDRAGERDCPCEREHSNPFSPCSAKPPPGAAADLAHGPPSARPLSEAVPG